ncbi:MAG: hypothetical protein HY601_02650 [Candidatus Omnitrophica bacterium]|nr:hypothetical protein [Candidatus Omnitrophota bacterium]
MKYIVLRCEDRAPAAAGRPALLAGAKTAHLRHLAQAGAAGVLRLAVPLDRQTRLRLHHALLGLGAGGARAEAGACCAAAIGVQLVAGETLWCCDLVAQRDGVVVDAEGGRIPTAQSRMLIEALNDALSSETRRWIVGEGACHLFAVRDEALAAEAASPVPAPEQLLGRPWRRSVPKGALGEALVSLLEQAGAVLEGHPVNRVRVDLGENPANLCWLWGGTNGGGPAAPAARPISAAALSNDFLVRGLTRSTGLPCHPGLRSLDERAFTQLLDAILKTAAKHDLVYAHVVVERPEPVDRLCAMERWDQQVLQPLSEQLAALGPHRLLCIIDGAPQEPLAWVAIGTGVPQRPSASLEPGALAETGLAFQDGDALFSWLTTEHA